MWRLQCEIWNCTHIFAQLKTPRKPRRGAGKRIISAGQLHKSCTIPAQILHNTCTLIKNIRMKEIKNDISCACAREKRTVNHLLVFIATIQNNSIFRIPNQLIPSIPLSLYPFIPLSLYPFIPLSLSPFPQNYVKRLNTFLNFMETAGNRGQALAKVDCL